MAPSAIIIGSSSGIGLEIARILAKRGYRLGLAARRFKVLQDEAAKLGGNPVVREIDLASPDEALKIFHEMTEELGQVDYVYICAGIGHLNSRLDWELESETIQINVAGFTAIAGAAFTLFTKHGKGHLVGVSSIAALMGSPDAPAYNASKAYMSNYLSGLRQRTNAKGFSLYVTDALPGFVDTAMMKAEKPFWVATSERAAKDIVEAVDRRRPRVYVTKRWGLIAALLRLLPFG